jgi:hypothetical protein
MLLLNINKYKVVLAIPLLSMSICLIAGVAFSKEENSPNLYQAFSNLLESASEENKHLLDSWNDYIIKVLGYSNAEHLKVIEELTIDYAKAFKALDEKHRKDREQDKIKYTSEWLDELIEQFGKDFICNNKRAVMLNLMIAFNRNNAKKYDQDAKEIISKELVLYLAYERYLGVFMDYYHQLGDKDRKKMKAWKEVAEKYLSIANRSHFAQVYYSFHMINKVRDNALQKENNELYLFFKNTNFPYGSGALKKAEKDLDIFVEMWKIQSLKKP